MRHLAHIIQKKVQTRQNLHNSIIVTILRESYFKKNRQPEVLCGFLNVLDDLQFTIPPEYQCISDHYFRYSVFFKDL